MSSPQTVPILRALAKERGIKGYSKLRKAELQEALGLEVTSPKAAVKAEVPSAAVEVEVNPTPLPLPTKLTDCIVVSQVYESNVRILIVPMEYIGNINKFQEQAALEIGDRELEDKDGGDDYIEKIVNNYHVLACDGRMLEIPSTVNVVRSVMVLMYNTS